MSAIFMAALANFLTATIGLGMAMIVFWQDARSRLNRLFGTYLLLVSGYGLSNIIIRYADEFNVSLRDALRASTLMFALALIMLLLFNFQFAQLKQRWARGTQSIAMVIGLFAIIYFTTQNWFTPPVVEASGHITYDPSTITLLLIVVTIGLLLLSAIALWQSDQAGSRALFWRTSLMPLSFSAFFIPFLDNIPMASITNAVVALLMTRVVLRIKLFDPLTRANLQLNATLQQLAATNAELAETQRKQNAFFARMSHELRTPLNAILGFSNLLLHRHYGDLNARQEQRVSQIERNSTTLLDLINDLLDLSKIGAGEMRLARRELDPVTALDQVAESVKPLFENKNLTLEKRYNGIPPIFADEARFSQIMTNLLSNAAKFTDAGSITIKAHTENDYVCFAVTDTGQGIPAKDIPYLFDEFFQVETVTGSAKGTGLGLAIVHRLVTLHDGRIWVESEVGRGSTFYFSIPVARQSQPAA